jgi:NADH-quinone oxidoreductase subunit M
MISLITFLPLLAALGAFLYPGKEARLARIWALGGVLASLAVILKLATRYSTTTGLQFVERHHWIPSLNIEYFVGIDGLNFLLVLLVGILSVVVVLASWEITERPRTYFPLLLLELTGLYGAFTALNFYHWFLFFEFSLVPAFFLIKLFGGERRDEAAIKFFLFTVLGSVALLLGFQLLYFKLGTFDFYKLAEIAATGTLPEQVGPLYPYIFLAVLLGLWVKTPLVPLHIWQPEAYSQAPVPVTILLSGLLSKLGVYGFLRLILPIFPAAVKEHTCLLLTITLATILLGAYAALRQNDIKKMLTYSSLNHVAYCILGISVIAVASEHAADVKLHFQSPALQGAILQMFSHGLTVAGLFYMLGRLEKRTGSRYLNDFGGLRTVIPNFTTLFSVLTFSSIGLPFLAGFASEFLIFFGAYSLAPVIALLSVLALLTTALFLLTMIQRVFTGPLNEKWKNLPDLSALEWITVTPLIALIVWVGVNPGFWLKYSELLSLYVLSQY